jgi:hypothetical protein
MTRMKLKVYVPSILVLLQNVIYFVTPAILLDRSWATKALLKIKNAFDLVIFLYGRLNVRTRNTAIWARVTALSGQ